MFQGSAANESGTGLASILETVRVLMADPSFRSSHSVIFVAFDKNHDGKIGSKRFISDYLLPHVINKFGCRLQVENISTVPLLSNTVYSGYPQLRIRQVRQSVDPHLRR